MSAPWRSDEFTMYRPTTPILFWQCIFNTVITLSNFFHFSLIITVSLNVCETVGWNSNIGAFHPTTTARSVWCLNVWSFNGLLELINWQVSDHFHNGDVTITKKWIQVHGHGIAQCFLWIDLCLVLNYYHSRSQSWAFPIIMSLFKNQ